MPTTPHIYMITIIFLVAIVVSTIQNVLYTYFHGKLHCKHQHTWKSFGVKPTLRYNFDDCVCLRQCAV